MKADLKRAFFRSCWAAALLILASGVFLAITIRDGSVQNERETVRELENLTFNLERNFLFRFQSADLALRAASQSFRRMHSAGHVSEEAFTDVLRGLQETLASGTDLRASDAEGRVIYGVGASVSSPIGIARRAFFVDARKGTDLGVGLPLKSRVSNKWVLPLAMSLRDEDGKFAGVIFANLDIADIGHTLTGLNIGGRGVATLFNDRSQVIMRSLDALGSEDEVPLRTVGPAIQSVVKQHWPNTAVESFSSIDGVMRLSMYRQVGSYPAYIVVGLERSQAQAPWRRQALVTGVFWLALLSGAMAFVFSQYRGLRRQTAMLEQLKEARIESERANESKSLFLANMSHEIRTPLNGVLGFAQIGARLPGASLEIRKAFGHIVDAGTLLHGVLNDVLDIAKIEAGKLQLHTEPVALHPLLQRAIALVENSAEEKGVAVHVAVARDVPPLVLTDSLRLEQVLLNLLSNAVKFTDRGRVELAVHAEGDSIVFAVRDSGIGMSSEQLKQLFRSFEQADASTTRRYGGSGLGLAITKRLVTMMGGTVDATSEPSVGSIFVVRLPHRLAESVGALDGDPLADPRTMDVVSISAHPRRLVGVRALIVEDNEVNQLVLRGMLEVEGASVETASDGYDAISRIRSGEVLDIVLMDVMMPGMDGYETARHILDIRPDLPIVGQTAHALQEDFVSCLAAGMVDRVVKPLVMEEVVLAIRRNIGIRAV